MPKEPFNRHPLRVRQYTAFVIAIGAVAFGTSIALMDFRSVPFSTLSILWLSALVIELFPIKETLIPALREMPLTQALHLAAIALTSVSGALLVGVAAALVAEIVRHRDWYKALFNLSAITITIVVSGLLYTYLAHFRIPFIIMFAITALAYLVISISAFVGLDVLLSGTKFSSAIIKNLKVQSLPFMGTSIISLLAVYLYRVDPMFYRIDPMFLLVSAVPVVVLSIMHNRDRQYLADNVTQYAHSQAAEVQQGLMPRLPCAREDIDVAFECVPYAEVEGDSVDAIEFDNSL